MNTITTAAQAVIATFLSSSTNEEIIAVLEDGDALAYLGFTDRDQEAIEEAHAFLRAKSDKTVTIGSVTFTANRTARSAAAVEAVANAKAIIEAHGYVIDTKGPSAGNDGRFNVYIYGVETLHRVGDKNSVADATHVFSVQYMQGRWFAKPTALAEAMAKGLRGFSDYLEEAAVYDAGFAAYRTSMADLDRIQGRA